MSEASISVIIPNYNRTEQLKIAITSVLQQTLQPLEILVCDDGSTENIEAVVSAFKNEKLKFIPCGKNNRPAVPRNKGIALAKGEWLAFLDNDDSWLPNKLERQWAETEKADMICSNAQVYRDNASIGTMHNATGDVMLNFYQMVQTNKVICSSVLVKKAVVLKAGNFPENTELRALEDYALWLRISTFATIKFIDLPLVNYTDASSTSIRKDSLTTAQQMALIHKSFVQWYANFKGADSHYLDLANEVLLRRYLTKFQKNLHRLRNS